MRCWCRSLFVVAVPLQLGCGGFGSTAWNPTVDPYLDEDGNLVLSAPGNAYPSPGSLAVDDRRIVLAYGFRRDTVVVSVPKNGGETTVVGRPGDNVSAVAVDGDAVYVATDHGVRRSRSGRFEPIGPQDRPVRALVVAGGGVWLADDDGVAWLDLSTGERTRVLAGYHAYTWSLLVADDRLYFACNGGATLTGFVPLEGGAATVLSDHWTVAFASTPIAKWGDVLVVPDAIGPHVAFLPTGGGTEGFVDCGPGMWSFDFAGGSAWFGVSVPHWGNKEYARTHPRPPTGGGGLFRCDPRTGETSQNLAPHAVNVSAIASDGDAVYFFDSERGLLLKYRGHAAE